MFLKCRLQSRIPGTERDCDTSKKLGSGKPVTFFLHTPTSRGDRFTSPPGFSVPVSHFSRKFSDLGSPPPLFLYRQNGVLGPVVTELYVSYKNLFDPHFWPRQPHRAAADTPYSTAICQLNESRPKYQWAVGQIQGGPLGTFF